MKEEDEGSAGPQGEYEDVPISEIEVWCGADGEGHPFTGFWLGPVRTMMTPAQARTVATTLMEAAYDAERGALLRSHGMSSHEIMAALADHDDLAVAADVDTKKFVASLSQALDAVLGRGPEEEMEASDGNTAGG